MGRLIAVFTAITLLVQAAAAAEITRVASSGDPDNPFDLDLSVSWVRTDRTASITREYAEAASPFATVKELKQLTYGEVTNLIVPRLAVGLWQDLELNAELPYYLSQETRWRLASGVGSAALPNTIQDNVISPDGGTYPAPHAIFATTPEQLVFQGGTLGDLKVGVSWAPFSQRRDDTKPTWVVGAKVTFPTAKLYDPGAGRAPAWESPYVISTKPGPVGEKVWRYDLQTTLSRRMGPAEPYFQADVTLLQKSSGTYSNCDHAAEITQMPDPAYPQARGDMVALCAADPKRWGARLPWYTGLTFGTELVAYEDRAADQKIAFDLRATGRYTSEARWYNELTHATGKLLATGASLTMTGRLGLLLRASEYVTVQAAGTFGWVSAHDLTGEDPAFVNDVSTNPNFDWRYDAPGRRFRATEQTVVGLEVSGMLSF